MKANELQKIANIRADLNKIRSICDTAAIQLVDNGPDHTSQEIELVHQMFGHAKAAYYEGIARGISVALSSLNAVVVV